MLFAAIIHLPANNYTGDNNCFKYNDFPLNAGYLKSYLDYKGIKKSKILFNEKFVFYNSYSWIACLRKINPEVLIAFIYPWNQEKTLLVINKLKHHLPYLKIIVLGSQASFFNYELVKKNKIDFAVIGTGEEAVFKILQKIIKGKNNFKEIEGVIFKQNGKIKFGKKKANFIPLAKIPSPYIKGRLNPNKKLNLILYETYRGCAKKCSYCYFGNIRIKKSYLLPSRIQKEMFWAKNKKIKNILFLDPIFNESPVRMAKICKFLIKVNEEKTINFEAFIRAELISQKEASFLKKANFTNLEIPLITINPCTAKLNNFKINLQKWLNGIKILKKEGLNFTVDIILGLPGDGLESFKKTVDFLTNNGLILNSECFIFSVHPSLKLQNNIKFQKNPPHHFLGAPSFGRKEITKAIKYLKYKGIRLVA